ncbi:MAG: acetyl-CoA C-acyltransferase [Ramlibacter sp.]|uniref:acetyl-CoA C-acyltransferase n=1 Tax=Ramlibacter sp. TaxID=1917967 RepID=UPI002635BBE6|nr:acetyl-CoA C-acyltransferase [Ramlibacter sp.]MDH4377012.1 acetyl-CoA C-acyltransferase [Ramlibacter sp.]
MAQALIAAAFRTPRGAAKSSGSLHGLTPAGLLGSHLRSVRERVGSACEAVEDALIGCVTQTGEQGGNVGKVATLLAGWSPYMSALTINRYCASGLSAVNLAALEALQGDSLVLAGGVEMMSRVPMFGDAAPHYSDKALSEVIGFMPPPWTSDLVATRNGFSRAACDEYAALSQARAAQARRERPMPSMLPVVNDAGEVLLAQDENIREGSTAEKLATLKAVYEGGAPDLDAWALAREPQLGTVVHVHTAGNAPCMADGAAAVIVGSAGALSRHGLQPRARILAMAEACVPLVQTGAVDATRRALSRAGLDVADIDLWEVRDSFAAITLHYIQTLGLDLARFNVNGSSIALGHPMGATGAMLVSCLLDELEHRDLRRGIVAIAGAAGVATAAVIERC